MIVIAFDVYCILSSYVTEAFDDNVIHVIL